ncbi:hypothetical protein [Marinicella litoralis]|uniref:Poly(3-hydroxybutyrate) depolymerase n=1 Tax=Marinicella litoralis TaxID=644220 RepID=A0A4R6XN73_9GAMM|nr:hypothetical protein [Marinicella litoralis]TDR17578.1 hypothetical protein C8D91_2637 [Marinicella litoralis]
MKIHIKLILLLFTASCHAAIDCTLPATVGGVQYCPNVGYQTCAIDVPSVVGVVHQRYFCFSQPNNLASANAAFMFHGGGHTGNAVAKHWSDQQNEAFIILPSARMVNGTRKWNTVNTEYPNFDALETIHGHSDTRFIGMVLNAINDQFSCDQAAPPVPCVNNHYAAGFSSGAAMVLQLLTRNEFSDQFSGYAAVSNYLDEAKKTPTQTLPNGNTIGNINAPFVPVPTAYMMGTDERINLPLKVIIDVVESGCPDPDLIFDDLLCFGSMVEETLYTNRLDTAVWLRHHLGTIKQSITQMYDNATDDTLITSQLYEADPTIPNAVSVWVGTVINGGHSWPSINNPKADPNHSEDFETAAQLITFWTDHADW